MNIYSTKIVEEIRTTHKGIIIVAQSKLSNLEKEVIKQVADENNKNVYFTSMNTFLKYKNRKDNNILVIE